MLKLRVSDLDAWVDFLEPEFEEFEISTEQFIAKMRGFEDATWEMQGGRAFHAVMEGAAIGDDVGAFEADGHLFTFSCDVEIPAYPIREGAIVTKVYDTPVGPVELRGRTDARDPVRRAIADFKVSFSTVDLARYGESMQWRAYLDMTDCTRFDYHVFDAFVSKVDLGKNVVPLPVEIRGHYPLTLWAYPEMSGEVRQRVIELADFVTRAIPDLMYWRSRGGREARAQQLAAEAAAKEKAEGDELQGQLQMSLDEAQAASANALFKSVVDERLRSLKRDMDGHE